MKNYVIINGVNSNTITGLMINELPPITKPQMRAIQEEIDGRDGDITTNLGYSAYDKTITIGLFGTGYDIDDIVAFFNGEGTIVFSNEDDKYYNFKILNQIDYVSLQKFKSASITFHCQPFKYPLTETPLEIEYSYVSDEGETISLNTALGEMKVNLLGNTSQTGTPTPDNPEQVHTCSGDNTITISNSDNTQSTSYPIHLGTYELCKIGTYQDKFFKNIPNTPDYKSNLDDNEWYLEKHIGKVVLDGSETGWRLFFETSGIFINSSILTSIDSASTTNCKSNYYTGTDRTYIRGNLGTTNNVCATNNTELIFANKSLSTASDFTTWLNNNNTIVYYVLSTPTYTKIEGTLKDELDEVYRASSFEGTTNISQNNNDKAFILNVVAMKEGSNEVQVNNIGNTYSKPLIALEGTGNINIYLDNTQILQANVEEKMNIDIAKLEAYNPDTSVLLNRQVIGNYNSMTIPSGTSIVRMDGELTKATITNYTRWL